MNYYQNFLLCIKDISTNNMADTVQWQPLHSSLQNAGNNFWTSFEYIVKSCYLQYFVLES